MAVTKPELAKALSRFFKLMPLTTRPSFDVDAGTMKPPGHMQNENTELRSVVCVIEYAAAGSFI